MEIVCIQLGIPQEKIDACRAKAMKSVLKPVEESEDKPQPLPEDPKEGKEDHKDDDDDKDPAPSNPAS